MMTFESYLHREQATPHVDGSTCPGCLEHPTAYILRSHAGANRPGTLTCVTCLRYSYGYDTAEELAASAALGGAVAALLDADVDVDLIRAAVNSAIDKYLDENSSYRGAS